MIRTYSINFSFDEIPEDEVEKIRAFADDLCLNVEIGPNFLEVELSARDNARRVLKFLHRLANIAPNPEGEGECLVSDEDGNISYEFYRISEGRLIFQPGHIVRGESRVLKISEEGEIENLPQGADELGGA